MHAGKTLDILVRMVSTTEFSIDDYCRFDSLVTGLERDIQDWGDNWPMHEVRFKLGSARRYFQDGCGLGSEGTDDWEHVKMFAGQDLYALRTMFLSEDEKSFKRPTE